MLSGILNKNKTQNSTKSIAEVRRVEIEQKLHAKLQVEKQALALKVSNQTNTLSIKRSDAMYAEDLKRVRDAMDLIKKHGKETSLFMQTISLPSIYYLPVKDITLTKTQVEEAQDRVLDYEKIENKLMERITKIEVVPHETTHTSDKVVAIQSGKSDITQVEKIDEIMEEAIVEVDISNVSNTQIPIEKSDVLSSDIQIEPKKPFVLSPILPPSPRKNVDNNEAPFKISDPSKQLLSKKNISDTLKLKSKIAAMANISVTKTPTVSKAPFTIIPSLVTSVDTVKSSIEVISLCDSTTTSEPFIKTASQVYDDNNAVTLPIDIDMKANKPSPIIPDASLITEKVLESTGITSVTQSITTPMDTTPLEVVSTPTITLPILDDTILLTLASEKKKLPAKKGKASFTPIKKTKTQSTVKETPLSKSCVPVESTPRTLRSRVPAGVPAVVSITDSVETPTNKRRVKSTITKKVVEEVESNRVNMLKAVTNGSDDKDEKDDTTLSNTPDKTSFV